MSVALPVASAVFGSITPPQGDIIDLQVHLGCSNEVSSFDCLLQNFDEKYSPSGTYPINVGSDATISLGRGSDCPLILTGKVEEIEPLSTATEHYIRVKGRCSGEQLFRRLVTKSWDNVKGEVVVKYLIDNYTSLSHNRGGTELIEDTDTTYTRLDYEDTPVFDIIKYIAETADKAGIIGYDFRIASDGKFEFFPKNSKTSSVSLSERLEVSEYAKNIHRIRNKITVYGAAERTKPTNKDSWTDGTADQSQSDLVEDSHTSTFYQLVSTLQFTPTANQKIALKKAQLHTKVIPAAIGGYYKITYQKGSGPETDIVTDQFFNNDDYDVPPGVNPKVHTCAINCDFGEQITVRFYTKAAGSATVYSKNYYMYYDILTYDWDPDQAGLGITLDATDKQQGTCSIKVSATAVTWAGATLTLADSDKVNGNKFANINVKVKLGSNYKGSGQIYLYSTQTPPNNYVSQPINMAVETWQNLQFAVGRKNRNQWFGYPLTFDWTQIKRIRLVFDLVGTSSGDFLFDHMFFGGGRWEATGEDSSSQTQYGLREKVETDEELHSDAECDYRSKALLDFLKGPIETLKVRSGVIDYGTTPLLAADKIHVAIPNENIDADYRIISVEYRACGRDQTLEVELELAKEPQLLADFIYGFRKSIMKLDKYKASASVGGAAGGGGGGSSMVQHSNEWHDPDMALQSDFASHKDRHTSGGADAFTSSDLLDAVSRVKVRKNSGASDVGVRRRLNLIEGSNVTLTVTDDPTDEEVDVTIASAGGGGGTPSDTVVNETNFGQSPSAGVASTYSRGDHTHGTPTFLTHDRAYHENDLIPSVASDPASPANGDTWFNSTDGWIKIRVGGVTRRLCHWDDIFGKPSTFPPSSHDHLNEWLKPNKIGRDAPEGSAVYTDFNTRDSVGSAVDNIFAPLDHGYGKLGSSSRKWKELYVSGSADIDRVNFGSTSHYLPYASSVHATLRPLTGNYSYLGTSTYYFNSLYAYNVRYKSLASFDALDDIGLLRRIKAHPAKKDPKSGLPEADWSTVPDEIKAWEIEDIIDNEGVLQQPKGVHDFIDAGALTGLLIGAVKQLADKVDELTARIATLEQKKT